MLTQPQAKIFLSELFCLNPTRHLDEQNALPSSHSHLRTFSFLSLPLSPPTPSVFPLLHHLILPFLSTRLKFHKAHLSHLGGGTGFNLCTAFCVHCLVDMFIHLTKEHTKHEPIYKQKNKSWLLQVRKMGEDEWGRSKTRTTQQEDDQGSQSWKGEGNQKRCGQGEREIGSCLVDAVAWH